MKKPSVTWEKILISLISYYCSESIHPTPTTLPGASFSRVRRRRERLVVHVDHGSARGAIMATDDHSQMHPLDPVTGGRRPLPLVTRVDGL